MFRYRRYLVQGIVRKDNTATRVSCVVKTRFKHRAIKLGRKYLSKGLYTNEKLIINKAPIVLKDGEKLA